MSLKQGLSRAFLSLVCVNETQSTFMLHLFLFLRITLNSSYLINRWLLLNLLNFFHFLNFHLPLSFLSDSARYLMLLWHLWYLRQLLHWRFITTQIPVLILTSRLKKANANRCFFLDFLHFFGSTFNRLLTSHYLTLLRLFDMAFATIAPFELVILGS